MLSDALGEYCICGHEEAFHKLELETYVVCQRCERTPSVHEFQLDNLVYVARRARSRSTYSRGLVTKSKRG